MDDATRSTILATRADAFAASIRRGIRDGSTFRDGFRLSVAEAETAEGWLKIHTDVYRHHADKAGSKTERGVLRAMLDKTPNPDDNSTAEHRAWTTATAAEAVRSQLSTYKGTVTRAYRLALGLPDKGNPWTSSTDADGKGWETVREVFANARTMAEAGRWTPDADDDDDDASDDDAPDGRTEPRPGQTNPEAETTGKLATPDDDGANAILSAVAERYADTAISNAARNAVGAILAVNDERARKAAETAEADEKTA